MLCNYVLSQDCWIAVIQGRNTFAFPFYFHFVDVIALISCPVLCIRIDLPGIWSNRWTRSPGVRTR